MDHSLSLYKDSIFLFGGRANKKVFNDLRLFNIASEKWKIQILKLDGVLFNVK